MRAADSHDEKETVMQLKIIMPSPLYVAYCARGYKQKPPSQLRLAICSVLGGQVGTAYAGCTNSLNIVFNPSPAGLRGLLGYFLTLTRCEFCGSCPATLHSAQLA
jgi:hypothetical protein